LTLVVLFVFIKKANGEELGLHVLCTTVHSYRQFLRATPFRFLDFFDLFL
jgi:hypothetical protein